MKNYVQLLGAIMVTTLIGGVLSAQSSFDAADLDPATTQVVLDYQTCLDEARVKAGAMKSVALKEKIFMGRVKSCDRKRDAQLDLIEVDQEFAKITENLIAKARSELGF